MSGRGGRGHCSVCGHPEKAAIEYDLAAGKSLRSLSLRFGISRQGLRAHKLNHAGPALTVLHRAAGAPGFIEEMRDLRQRLLRQLDSAELSGNAAVALAAIREIRETARVLARATGEDQAAAGAVDILQSEEWGRLRADAVELIREFLPAERVSEFARRLAELPERRRVRGA